MYAHNEAHILGQVCDWAKISTISTQYMMMWLKTQCHIDNFDWNKNILWLDNYAEADERTQSTEFIKLVSLEVLFS